MRLIYLASYLFLSLCALGLTACAEEVVYDNDQITIETKDGRSVPLIVEYALNDEQRTRGLMYRESLPEDHGMAFIYEVPNVQKMWMRNTLIPLDMIFFNEANVITFIHENAVPKDDTTIGPDFPVLGVLEVNAGFAKKHKIRLGDKIVF